MQQYLRVQGVGVLRINGREEFTGLHDLYVFIWGTDFKSEKAVIGRPRVVSHYALHRLKSGWVVSERGGSLIEP